MAIHLSSIKHQALKSLGDGSGTLVVLGGVKNELSQRVLSDDRVRLLNGLVDSWAAEVTAAAVVMFLKDSSERERDRVMQVCALKDIQCIKIVQTPQDIEAFVDQLPPVSTADAGDGEPRPTPGQEGDTHADSNAGVEQTAGTGAAYSAATAVGRDETGDRIAATLDQLLSLCGTLDEEVRAILARGARAPKLESENAALKIENTRLADENVSLRQQIEEVVAQSARLRERFQKAVHLLGEVE